MKKYVRVTEESAINHDGVFFCVSESEHKDFSEVKTVLTCDARTADFARNVRWMICTKYGLTDGEYECACSDYHEEEHWCGATNEVVTETTETYTFEVEE